MRKKFLEKRMARLQEKRDKIAALAAVSTDAAEVRSLTADLQEIDADIAECREEIALIDAEAEERANMPVTVDTPVPAEATKTVATTAKRNENMLDSKEYRMAFMAYVQRGTEIPAEFRSGDAIDTTDTGAAIPLTIMREVINTVRTRYGNLYNKVRKLSVQGGVEFPIGELEADFHWITEATVSPDQELDKLGKVSFGYHVAEIRIAQTFLSSIVTMEAFEAKIAEVIARAYLKAMDTAIVKGTGNGQMLGILNDTRIPAGNVVSFTAAELSDWTKWRKNFFAKLPLGYRNGEFIFPLATVDAYLETMADSNNNPIFRQATGLEVNDGDAINPNGRFFGRDIALVEPDIITDFDTASSGDVIGIYWQPQEYAINENFGFTMRRYFDEDRNKWINKALVVVDGKILNPLGFWLIKKA